MTEILEKVKRKIEQLNQRIEIRSGENYHDESKKTLILGERLAVYEELLPEIASLITTVESQKEEITDLQGQLKETKDWETDAYAWRDLCDDRNSIVPNEFTVESFVFTRQELAELKINSKFQIESLQKENERLSETKQMLDKDKLLDDIREKLRVFKREHDATTNMIRKEMIYGELKMLRYYLKEIESGNFEGGR